MRLQLMSQRIAAVRKAAISPNSVPPICRIIRNIATIPASPNATATNRALVMDTPASFTTSAIGTKNAVGRLVNAENAPTVEGSFKMCCACSMLSASSNHKPGGNSSRLYSRTAAPNSTIAPSAAHGSSERISNDARLPAPNRRTNREHLPSIAKTAPSASGIDKQKHHHACVVGGPCGKRYRLYAISAAPKRAANIPHCRSKKPQ